MCLPVPTPSSGRCTMSNSNVKVVNNQNSRDSNRQSAVTFTCSNGYSDAANGAYGVASDAFFYGDLTAKLYTTKYSWTALSWTPRMVTHYGSCYDNAFWDGTDMYFGDGCSTFYPLVSQDVIAHELAHGITSTNSRLVYSGQSGGINEAFSDISGEAAEIFEGRTGGNDWLVGFDLFKSASRALRYFRRPEDDGRSISTVSQYYNGMDVHYSSGIFNIAFYRLVETEGMDIYDAYECFLHANRFKWTSRSTFNSGACGVARACNDLGFDHNKVQRAFTPGGVSFSGCSLLAVAVQLATGQTKEKLLVSERRNPMLKLEPTGSKATVEALAEDFTTVSLEITTDVDGQNVIATGEDEVEFDVPNNSDVFVKLSSTSSSDVSVTVQLV